jgi:hypothetical protein
MACAMGSFLSGSFGRSGRAGSSRRSLASAAVDFAVGDRRQVTAVEIQVAQGAGRQDPELGERLSVGPVLRPRGAQAVQGFGDPPARMRATGRASER